MEWLQRWWFQTCWLIRQNWLLLESVSFHGASTNNISPSDWAGKPVLRENPLCSEEGSSLLFLSFCPYQFLLSSFASRCSVHYHRHPLLLNFFLHQPPSSCPLSPSLQLFCSGPACHIPSSPAQRAATTYTKTNGLWENPLQPILPYEQLTSWHTMNYWHIFS